MSDLSQHGLIATLQRLQHHAGLEEELERGCREHPVALILPCHAGDLGRPALRRICRELSGARFLAEVVVPVNGLERGERHGVSAFFRDELRLPHRLLWCDTEEGDRPHSAFRPGKGANVWASIGLLLRERQVRSFLLADADVTTFRREMLARLAFALVDPRLGYAFAKSYYPRVSDRIYGRVSRLFVAPLLEALVRTSGHLPMLDYLRAFRYPLAGECGMGLDLAERLPVEAGWGLEVGMLCELFREIDPREVCQVDAGVRYDHKHQPLGDGERGLVGMCAEVAQTLLRYLTAEGLKLGAGFEEALLLNYAQEGREALRRSAALAAMNGLHYDGESEQAALTAFGAVLAGVRSGEKDRLPAWRQAGSREWAWLEAALAG